MISAKLHILGTWNVKLPITPSIFSLERRTVTIPEYREKVYAAYNNTPLWVERVNKMSDSQLIACYNRFINDPTLARRMK